MLTYDQDKNQLNLTIPVRDIDELREFQQGLLGVLAVVQVGHGSEPLNENIKSMYRLMRHLLPDSAYLYQAEELPLESSEMAHCKIEHNSQTS